MTVQESGENSGKKLQKQSLMFKVVLITATLKKLAYFTIASPIVKTLPFLLRKKEKFF
jgi:hypothetical protein